MKFFPAKQIIRRTSAEEKYLVVYKKAPGHRKGCDYLYITIAIIDYYGIGKEWSDFAYSTASKLIGKYGEPVSRKCETNDTKDCGCQG